jgi:tetratricopeptide (TPR) repeat protein
MRILSLVLLVVSALQISSNAGELESISSDGLKFCILDYRNGYYNRAVDCINDVLPKLTTLHDSLESYKMLALSYGMSNQIEKAREYFRIALEKDSTMDIDTLAFPPNIALIYTQVKQERKISRIEGASSPQPVTIDHRKKNVAAKVLLLSSAVMSAGGGAGLYYNGYLARNEYSSLKNNQALIDRTWQEFTYSIAGGVGCTILAGFSTWFFLRVINQDDPAVSISGWKNGIALIYKF